VPSRLVRKSWIPRAAAGETTNGWKYTFAGGRAGYDPGLRAALAKYEVGAQLSDQVIYPNTSVDEKGKELTGTRKYVLHFDPGKLPPDQSAGSHLLHQFAFRWSQGCMTPVCQDPIDHNVYLIRKES
jgi:hypothetical protein